MDDKTPPRTETPASEDEKPASWSGVEAEANETDAVLVVGFLQNHGIPARVVDGSFHLTPTSGEDLSPMEVAVPTDRLEEARAVLARRESEFSSSPEGSDTLLTDEGLAEIDPQNVEGKEE